MAAALLALQPEHNAATPTQKREVAVLITAVTAAGYCEVVNPQTVFISRFASRLRRDQTKINHAKLWRYLCGTIWDIAINI